MKIVYYDKDCQFELTDEEYQKALVMWDQGKSVYLTRIEANLTPFYKWSGKRPPDHNRRTTHDGTLAVKRFGYWVMEKDPSIRLDPVHYPELYKETTDDDIKKITSKI